MFGIVNRCMSASVYVVYSLQQFGFTEEFIDEIKETLSSSNLSMLATAAVVTAVQLICEVLALKNDIIAWRKKTSMVGISRISVLSRCLCSLLIFLHLLEETSLLVLLPVGLGACTEVWKVFKLFNIRLQWKACKPQASRYLSYLVYPPCISGAIFSLFYLRQKSCYSWLINALVTGVYAFGFLSMAPQLFVNYKLKSVSHLPAATLVYRGANTLIADLCSGASFFSPSLSLSSSHPLSYFRDELLLFIYLYQRWCYSPKTRPPESGTQSKKVKAH